MRPARRELAEDLYARSHAHDQGRSDRLERFRNVEPATAELLGVVVRACGAQRILELGTSNGYSTIWLADAAEETGGRVLTVDLDPARTEIARGHLREAGLEDRVELRSEDAQATLRSSSGASWDFVFLDAERPAYTGYLEDLARVLAPGGLLAVDNVLSHEHELVEFTALIERDARFAQTVLSVGAGLRLAARER